MCGLKVTNTCNECVERLLQALGLHRGLQGLILLAGSGEATGLPQPKFLVEL